MENSEVIAQKYLKNRFGTEGVFIRKIPDFKQTGSMIGGLPDYLVICSNTYWYEIKYLNNRKKSFSIDEFTEQQLPTFNKMLKAKAEIIVLIIWGKEKYEVDCNIMV